MSAPIAIETASAAAPTTPVTPGRAAGRVLRPLTLVDAARSASVLLMCHDVHLFGSATGFAGGSPPLVQPMCRIETRDSGGAPPPM